MGRRGGAPISFGDSKPVHKNNNRDFKNRRREVEEPEEQENEISYLQPEILPQQIMIDIFEALGAKLSDAIRSERSQLAAYFYKHITPKPQRVYDDLHRVMKKLRKNQKKLDKKSQEADWQHMVQESKGKSRHNSNTDRLKPAPSSNSPRFSTQPAKKEVNLDDLVIISRPKKKTEVTESSSSCVVKLPESVEKKPLPPLNLERKTLKLKRKSTDVSTNGTNDTSPKKICLTDNSISKRPAEETDNGEQTTKKKKITLSFP